MPTNQDEKIKIMDILSPSAIIPELSATSKRGVLEELIALLKNEGKVKDAATTVDVLIEREKLGSTGIGQGIAIPHAKSDQATHVAAAFGVSRRGVQFDALDGEPVHIVFVLVAPPDAAVLHLKALARISRLLKDKFFRQALREARTVPDILKLIREEDQL